MVEQQDLPGRRIVGTVTVSGAREDYSKQDLEAPSHGFLNEKYITLRTTNDHMLQVLT